MSFALPYAEDYSLPALQWHHEARAWCRDMRLQGPLAYDEHFGWALFSHQLSAQVFADHQNYSSEYEMSASAEAEEARSIITMDPPRHQLLRSLMTQAFSARRIAQMETRIQQIAVELLSKIEPGVPIDFMDAVAAPLPVIVIAELLGLDTKDWPLFKTWTDAQVRGVAQQEGTQQALTAYFFQAVERKRRQPDQSLISLLLAAEVEGKHLTNPELFSFFLTLLVAGNVTTTNLLGNAMLCFHLFPQELASLREQPALMGSAVEETLRFMSPSRVLPHSLIGARIAKRDTELAGQQIEKGAVVRPIIPSANFDEQQFPSPEAFQIDRQPNRHLSFGHGIHFCLGAPLARLESRIVLTEMCERFTDWELVDPDHLEQVDMDLIFGVKHLPMTFEYK
jgi:cytochrome P450